MHHVEIRGVNLVASTELRRRIFALLSNPKYDYATIEVVESHVFDRCNTERPYLKLVAGSTAELRSLKIVLKPIGLPMHLAHIAQFAGIPTNVPPLQT